MKYSRNERKKQPLLKQEEAACVRGATIEDVVTDELRDLTCHRG